MPLTKGNESPVERSPAPAPMFGWPQWLTGLDPLRGLFDDMRLEEFVDGDELVVRAELPGVDPDKDVTITLDRGRLTIAAERKDEKKTTDQGVYRSEFRYGQYKRTVTLPPGTDEADVKATYADGILTVRLPFAEPKTAQTIPVTKV